MYALLLVTGLLSSTSPTVDASVPLEDLTRSETIVPGPEGMSILLEGGLPGDEGGMPDLPVLPWTVRLPAGREASGVTVTAASWETVSPSVRIAPLPDPLPLSLQARAAAPVPREDVYGVDAFWPVSPVLLTGTGMSDGVPVAELCICPYRYNPVRGDLERLTGLEVSISTRESGAVPLAGPRDDSRRMLIVTDDSLLPVFGQLAARRTDEGIVTDVVTMSEVYAAAGGRDQAEELRNYILDRYQTEGLDFVLLGGDTDFVPYRTAYAMTCQAGMHPREDSLPCDLYFSDLDGTWDDNGNDLFGEIDDNVDLWADVCVGRVTVEDLEEAEAWYGKQTAYEDCTASDHLDRALFLAMVLWWNPYTDSGESKNLIEELYMPYFFLITKLYESLGNENIATVMMALNEGQNLVNHDGHAWYSSIGVGDGYMTAENFDAIDSDGRYAAFLYSIGCWSAAFDFDAVSEHFLTCPSGCGVAWIGNSSYGWGSPGNPTHGYSDVLDRLYFGELFDDYGARAGELLARTKEYYIPYSQWENVYRWHEYDVNLLGDPSFRPYRMNPATPAVDCPGMVSAGTDIFPVTVSGVPTEGLLLCVHDQGSEYFAQELDATGQAVFDFAGAPTGDVTVTVTGGGVRRTSFTVSQGSGPDPVVSDVEIDDSGGDGFLSPGDEAQVTLTLLNQGTEALSGITLTADVASGPGYLTSSQMTFPDLAAGSSAQGSAPLDLSVMPTAESGDVVDMDLQLTASQGDWSLDLPVMVFAPGLYFATYSVDDGGDGVPDPGETFTLTLDIANLGLTDAQDVSLVMTGYPAWISWQQDSAWAASVPAGGTEPFDLVCELSPSAPSPSFPWLYFDLESVTASYQTADTVRLTVGETGTSNDVEGGEAGWTHQGTGDLWNITTGQSHSPSHSWFCGDAGGYDPGMDCGLLSPPIILAPDAALSFWTTFDVAIYGTDGLYPLVHHTASSTTDTLDYIGSGGALPYGGRGIGTGWVTYGYDLSYIEAGEEVQIEFRFVSDYDSETGAGFYLDDILVEGGYLGSMGGPGPGTQVDQLGLPRPNPASYSFSLPIFLEEPGRWTVGIYDLSGRLVRSEEGESPLAGTLVIDVTDLSPGVYFLRLSGTGSATRRLAVVR